MTVTTKTIDDVRWRAGVSVDPSDTLLAIVVREEPREEKMDPAGLQRDVVMLGSGYESADEAARELLLRLESVPFDPGWARLVRTDGVVDFGYDEYEPR